MCVEVTALAPRRVCTKCGDNKLMRYFGTVSPLRGAPTARVCLQCKSDGRHGRMILKEHGITEEYYQELLAFQDGRCAICGNRPRTKRLAVDHNHVTGTARGLLCKNCNYRILGGVRDSVDTLQIAIRYLLDPPARRMNDTPDWRKDA